MYFKKFQESEVPCNVRNLKEFKGILGNLTWISKNLEEFKRI